MVLDYLTRVEKTKQQTRELKLALVTARILEPFDAFPELNPGDEVDEDELPDDEDAVTYVFSQAPEDTESIEDEIRALVASAAEGTTRLTDWV